jgi:hypothetical protein
VVADYLLCFAFSVTIAGARLTVIRVRFTSTISRNKGRKERDAAHAGQSTVTLACTLSVRASCPVSSHSVKPYDEVL